MNRKAMIALFALIVVTGVAIFAFTTSKSTTANTEKAKIEQVSSENSSHCDPSNCTPEQAAKCPAVGASSTSNSEASATCPQTKDCPPSKCSPDKGGEKATL
ncbi:MAG: hypothetical protein ACHQFW_08865 [Chitinophagales bacterium]